MAKRPFFFVSGTGMMVRSQNVEFEWYAGFSAAQKKRSVASLHEEVKCLGYKPLEISTKSNELLGAKLSAFALKLDGVYLENIFQSSKVFQNGGPYMDLLQVSPKEAKRDERLRTSGPLKGFLYQGEMWELKPTTAFYDWIYLQAVKESVPMEELKKLLVYTAFTDIEFNPAKSVNTQARTVALLKAILLIYGQIPDWNEEEFLEFHKKHII